MNRNSFLNEVAANGGLVTEEICERHGLPSPVETLEAKVDQLFARIDALKADREVKLQEAELIEEQIAELEERASSMVTPPTEAAELTREGIKKMKRDAVVEALAGHGVIIDKNSKASLADLRAQLESIVFTSL
jgi:regulator of replication initiation timing